MKRFTATNTMPVTTKVMFTVSSIIFQLEAMGVNHQGLRKWNRIVPTTNRTNATASAIPIPLRSGSAFRTRPRRSALHDTEWIDEVAVHGRELGFRVPRAHHPGDACLLRPRDIDEDQIAARFKVVMESA